MMKGEEKFITVALKEFKLQTGEPYNNFENWNRESTALRTFNKLNNPHIVRGIGAYKQDNRYFIIMERAEHGDLTSIWKANADVHLNLKTSLVAEFLEQFRGLANALREMHQYRHNQSSESNSLSGPESPLPRHNTPGGLEVPTLNAPPSTENWRHGDLKPANILSFKGEGGSLLGTLKLADLGRARQHPGATKDRSGTVEKCSTWEYDPPEIWADLEKERSRFVDIWSFGCVLLESLIWLLFGSKELRNFSQTQSRDGFGTLYWSVGNMSTRTTMFNNSTSEWLSRLLKDDPECKPREQGSAMHDLLKLIINGLLVVKYPGDYEKVQRGRRFNCQRLVEELDRIIEKGHDNPEYLFSGQKREGIAMPKIAQVGDSNEQKNNQSLSPYRRMSGANVAQRRTRAPWQARPLGSPEPVYDSYMHEFDNKWHYVDDAAFATRVMGLLQGDLCQLLPTDGLSVACDVCQSIDLNKANFGSDYSPTKHRQLQSSKDCELCGYLLGIAAEASEKPIEEPESQAQKQSMDAAQDLTVLTIRNMSGSGLSHNLPLTLS